MKYMFIYGSLMTGHFNNGKMLLLGGKLVGEAVVYKRALFAVAKYPYPFMVSTENYTHEVNGELWEFEDNADIGAIEQMERSAGYCSIMDSVFLKNEKGIPGEYFDALTYIYPGFYVNSNDKLVHIQNGDIVSPGQLLLRSKWVGNKASKLVEEQYVKAKASVAESKQQLSGKFVQKMEDDSNTTGIGLLFNGAAN